MFSSKNLLTRFHEYSRTRRLIGERQKIVVAVSGGIDSIVLLDLLAREQESFGLSVIVAHFNFQLRGEESDADEVFVRERAQHYGFEFYVERANTAEFAKHHKLGIQEAARNLRYVFFEKLLISSGFDKVATAHHANDNAETMLLNLFRGAGVQGLAGIPVLRDDKKIIRPLLFAERHEIEKYAEAEELRFRTDSSNQEDYYTRNYIRHNILPQVQLNVNPKVVKALNRSAELLRELEAFLTYSARQTFDLVVSEKTSEELFIAIPRMRTSPKLIQQYIVMLVAETFARKNLEFDQVQSILELTEGLTGSWVSISKEYVVFRDRDNLVFRKVEETPKFKITVQLNQRYKFGDFLFSSEILEQKDLKELGVGKAEFVEAERIYNTELVLRSWTDGDSFVPLGMNSRKKISDFFVDAKIPIYEKHHIPILETKNGEVVWVCGHRIDERFKITPETRRVLKLQFSTSTNGADEQKDKN